MKVDSRCLIDLHFINNRLMATNCNSHANERSFSSPSTKAMLRSEYAINVIDKMHSYVIVVLALRGRGPVYRPTQYVKSTHENGPGHDTRKCSTTEMKQLRHVLLKSVAHQMHTLRARRMTHCDICGNITSWESNTPSNEAGTNGSIQRSVPFWSSCESVQTSKSSLPWLSDGHSLQR